MRSSWRGVFECLVGVGLGGCMTDVSLDEGERGGRVSMEERD